MKYQGMIMEFIDKKIAITTFSSSLYDTLKYNRLECQLFKAMFLTTPFLLNAAL